MSGTNLQAAGRGRRAGFDSRGAPGPARAAGHRAQPGTPAPEDSFLLVHQLPSIYQGRPRVVMKATLQLDPSLDIVGNQLPNVFIK